MDRMSPLQLKIKEECIFTTEGILFMITIAATTAIAAGILRAFAFVAYNYPKQYSELFPWLVFVSSELTTCSLFLRWSECSIAGAVVLAGIVILRFLPVLKITKHKRKPI
jgi:hypothetical protein